MKPLPSRPPHGPPRPASALAGIVLIDCLVYLGMFLLIVNLAFALLYRTWDTHRALRRSADDIAAVVRAGEVWRADVRAASGPLRTDPTPEGWDLHVPRREGDVLYRLAAGRLVRVPPGRALPTHVLPNVKSSSMQPDPRSHVTAWRWDLELKPSRAKSRVRPLFTFLAVPPAVP